MTKIFNRRFAAALLSVAMAAILFAGFGTPAWAAEEDGATISFAVLDTQDGYYGLLDGPYDVAAGDSLYGTVNDYFGDDEALYGDWDPIWEAGVDPFNGDTIHKLLSFLECNETEDFTTIYPDGESGISAYWDWIYTINGDVPIFGLNPEIHFKAMDQYEVQDGDEIELTYSYIVTRWTGNDYMLFEAYDYKGGNVIAAYEFEAE
ncbi:MAG: hypothetical protein LBP30_00570 [Clostridiales Family XIII bacterium]|nr:hypothetical protein [Clostridiales Family XIII bacterium]